MASTEFHSPIEERHIDFLLEEEFAANAEFLRFFIETAQASRSVQEWSAPLAHIDHSCRAVRSATTVDGETDVLVTYRSESGKEKVAVLIEDKIGAAFQPAQAERYRLRGERGLGTQWDRYWTCLVAPKSYAPSNQHFDSRVSLEELKEYFAKTTDARSLYKAGVFQQALAHAAGGLKNVDGVMTSFRASYARLAEQVFSTTPLMWEPPRDAWYDDSWFKFTSDYLPRNARLLHKTKAGVVHLAFTKTSADELRSIFVDSPLPDDCKVIESSGSASLEIAVPKIRSFEHFEASEAAVRMAFNAVERLFQLAGRHSSQPNTANLGGKTDLDEITTARLKALEFLLQALIRARAVGYRSTAPAVLPSLVDISRTGDRREFYNSPEMVGTFEIYLDLDEPSVYLNSGSRTQSQWMFHKISLFKVESLPYDEVSDIEFQQFIEENLNRK